VYDRIASGRSMKHSRDYDLGMDRNITRRDFLNGMALVVGGSLIPPPLLRAFEAEAAPEKAPGYYPPALAGLRGSHPGSFETAHSLRDGTFWGQAGLAEDTAEKYDLVVVGGGISGLSAAYFYRQAAGGKARILILDNHDDFGGHAKRNEFRARGRFLLGYGGTYAIESPAPYSAVAKGLINELGIDVSRWPRIVDPSVYSSLGLRPAVFFDRETFGADRLVKYSGEEGHDFLGEGEFRREPPPQFLAEAPLSEAAKQDLTRIYRENKDYLPGLASAEKKGRLARISYADFLTKLVGVHPEVLSLFQALPHGLFGVGIDAVSAQDAWGLGCPGFEGLKLDPGPGPGMNRDAIPNEEAREYFFHFPDGNASIARLLVRALVPEAIPGGTVDGLVTARANYARLDDVSSPIRIRLNSTAVRVRHLGSPQSATETEIVYVRRGKLYTVRAGNCVLACWHVVIPYICAELPKEQRAALADCAKVPIVYTNVAITNWKAFQKLGVKSAYAPGSYHTSLSLDLPVSLGDYQCPHSPDQPIVVRMTRTPCQPGLPARDQHRQGRIELFITSFETFERKIRDQLARILGAGGFDPARDIAAITVNRWPHGYAYEYNSLWDKFWLEGGEQPCVIARKPFGRVAIANADADAYAYTDAAIDQAYRAVQEIRGRR
jgi:spermidine dehydrogenase